MRIVCCQLDLAWEDKLENYRRLDLLLRKAGVAPGSLLVLPEMFASGFSMEVAKVVEAPSGPTEAFLARVAREWGVFVLAGVATLAAEGRGRNQAVAFSPEGQLLARYNKLHPFTLGCEDQYYLAGDEVVTWPWRDTMVAPFICYDLRFPELFRSAVRRGAHVFCVIANWPSKRESHWITLLQARAIENQAYVAGVNRCGTDPKHIYSGRSVVIDPHGQILADAGDQEGLISWDLDIGALEQWRKDFPALRDMRWRG